MATAIDVKTTLANLVGLRTRPTVKTSKRIYTFTNEAFKRTGGAPPKLVDMYKANAFRHIKK